MAAALDTNVPSSPAETLAPIPHVAVRALWILLVFGCSLTLAVCLRLGGCAYMAYALAGSFAVHFQERRTVRELTRAIACGALYFAAYVAVRGPFHPYVGWWAGTAAGFAGLGSLLMLFIRAAEAQRSESETILATLRRATVVPALCAVSLLAVFIGVRLAPRTWDYTLYRFDRLLAVDTFAIGRWFLSSAVVFNTCAVAYDILPLYICATLMVAWAKGRWRTATRMAVALGIAGFIAYQICPAAGPLYAFPKYFPWRLPSPALLPAGRAAAPDGLRNAMPSLHLGFALICYWILAPLGRWLRLGATVYLLITALATVGFGEHYFVDLIVAVPLAVAVYGSCSESVPAKRRRLVTTAATVMTICWLLALRTDAVIWSSQLAWVAVLTTLIGSLALKRWILARALENRSGNVERALLGFGVDAADVFTDDADAHHLQSAKK
jgi:hypothetical protein